jgi:hypothetical protein
MFWVRLGEAAGVFSLFGPNSGGEALDHRPGASCGAGGFRRCAASSTRIAGSRRRQREIAKDAKDAEECQTTRTRIECSAGVRNTSAQVGGALRALSLGVLRRLGGSTFSSNSSNARRFGSTDCHEEPIHDCRHRRRLGAAPKGAHRVMRALEGPKARSPRAGSSGGSPPRRPDRRVATRASPSRSSGRPAARRSGPLRPGSA